MKKALTAVLAALLVLYLMAPALAEAKIGQPLYAAHGTKCFSLMTVAVDGDVIVDAYIDEFQVMDSTLTTPRAQCRKHVWRQAGRESAAGLQAPEQ